MGELQILKITYTYSLLIHCLQIFSAYWKLNAIWNAVNHILDVQISHGIWYMDDIAEIAETAVKADDSLGVIRYTTDHAPKISISCGLEI